MANVRALRLAVAVGRGEAARVDLQNTVLTSVKLQAQFREDVLKFATEAENDLANYARSSGGDFMVLCNIAYRHLGEEYQ